MHGQPHIKFGAHNFEIVKVYTYLVKILTNKSELKPEIAKIITKANRAYYALPSVLNSQSVL